MAPASTVLDQSAVPEGDELLLGLLAHLRRQYYEVYGSPEGTSRAHERRDIHIREGRGLSHGNSSVLSGTKIGAYAGRLANINLSEINNPSPNLTTVYLDTPLVGPTPEPVKYVPSPGRLGQPSGYPPTSTGPSIGGFRSPPPPPLPPYHTHPQMNPPTGPSQPRRVLQPATGQAIVFETSATRG